MRDRAGTSCCRACRGPNVAACSSASRAYASDCCFPGCRRCHSLQVRSTPSVCHHETFARRLACKLLPERMMRPSRPPSCTSACKNMDVWCLCWEGQDRCFCQTGPWKCGDRERKRRDSGKKKRWGASDGRALTNAMAMERSRVCVALHAPQDIPVAFSSDFESQNNKPLGRNWSTRDQVLGTNSRARDKYYLVAYLTVIW